jgi:hypothetical protein
MRALCLMVVALACTVPAFGQAQNPDDLQPGVNTSAMPSQPPVAPPAAKAASSAPAPAPSAAAAKAPPSGTGGKAAHAGKASDRIDLDTTQITGNKELPKVMYVVPWKRSDLGDLTGKPANSLIDEVLQPVDRDVFNREERYYHTVAAEKSSPPPPSGAPADH